MRTLGKYTSGLLAIALWHGCSNSAPSTSSDGAAAVDAGGSGGTTGSGGSGIPSGSGGSGGSGTGGASGGGAGGSAGSGGGGTGGTEDAGGVAPEVGTDVATGQDAARPATILVYTRATGFVHDSTPLAADTISRAATAVGITAERSDDPAKFTAASLAKYGAVILIATSGEPLGSPGTAAIDALVAYVKGGGALIGIENATNAHNNSDAYVSLFGAVFAGHPELSGTCLKVGDHASVKNLPASFNVVDEIYAFTRMRADNQIVLRCGRGNYPVSWYREEGAGRIFYTALGHYNDNWTKPPLADGHVLPGLLWAMRR